MKELLDRYLEYKESQQIRRERMETKRLKMLLKFFTLLILLAVVLSLIHGYG